MNTNPTDFMLALASATQHAPPWWKPQLVSDAIDALGVTQGEADFRERTTNFIYARAWFYRNAFAGDKGPEPKAIQEALNAIPDAFRTIGESLSVIWQARLSEPAQASERAMMLRAAHALILDSLMRDILPVRLTAKFDNDDFFDCLPDVAIDQVNPPGFRFFDAAIRIENFLSPFNVTDWKKGTTRPRDPRFDELIAALAKQFAAVTGKPATAYNRNGDTSPLSPFAKMINKIWPVFDDNGPPTNDKIRAALKAASLLPSQ